MTFQEVISAELARLAMETKMLGEARIELMAVTPLSAGEFVELKRLNRRLDGCIAKQNLLRNALKTYQMMDSDEGESK